MCKKVESVVRETPAIEALYQMHRKNVSSLAITDVDHRLVSILSSSDLRGFVLDDFPFLALQVENFLNTRKLRRPCARGPSEDRHAVLAPAKATTPYIVTADITLKEAVQRLASSTASRLYVVDADFHPLSVVSPTDILRVIVDKFGAP